MLEQIGDIYEGKRRCCCREVKDGLCLYDQCDRNHKWVDDWLYRTIVSVKKGVEGKQLGWNTAWYSQIPKRGVHGWFWRPNNYFRKWELGRDQKPFDHSQQKLFRPKRWPLLWLPISIIALRIEHRLSFWCIKWWGLLRKD